jgi:hypothetical protein
MNEINRRMRGEAPMTGSQFFNDLSAATSGIGWNSPIKVDAERDAAALKKVEDEKLFIQEFLHNHEDVENMADNVDSIAGIAAYLKPEFEIWLADKNHDKELWND